MLFEVLLSWSLSEVFSYFLLFNPNVLSAFVTATLKSWSLYIHGYTTRSPPQSMDHHRQWSESSVSSSSPCEEPGSIDVFTQTGFRSAAHSLLISFCLVLWKAVVLTCSSFADPS